MQAPASETHVEKEQARAGSTPGIVRYVLLISIGLAIIALSAIWMAGALTAPEDTGSAAQQAETSANAEVGNPAS